MSNSSNKIRNQSIKEKLHESRKAKANNQIDRAQNDFGTSNYRQDDICQSYDESSFFGRYFGSANYSQQPHLRSGTDYDRATKSNGWIADPKRHQETGNSGNQEDNQSQNSKNS